MRNSHSKKKVGEKHPSPHSSLGVLFLVRRESLPSPSQRGQRISPRQRGGMHLTRQHVIRRKKGENKNVQRQKERKN